jgi:hypothetical protein
MLGEFHRTLSPTGVARIATPDLGIVARLLDHNDDQARAYVCRANIGWERYHVSRSPCPSVRGTRSRTRFS